MIKTFKIGNNEIKTKDGLILSSEPIQKKEYNMAISGSFEFTVFCSKIPCEAMLAGPVRRKYDDAQNATLDHAEAKCWFINRKAGITYCPGL